MRLLLHIGTEKTGTTLLQRWLYSNRAALSAQGVFLSAVAGRPNNRKLVSYFQSDLDDFTRRLGVVSKAEKVAFFSGFLTEFESELELAQHSHHTMVITSEHFHSRLTRPQDIAALAGYLQPLFSEICVLCYFREQSALRESLYSTALRVEYKDRLAAFFPDIGPQNYYYNCHDIADRWAEAFGAEALICRIYDRMRFVAQDIRRDFLTALPMPADVSVVESQLDFSQSSSNESLGPLQGRLLQAINRTVPFWASKGGVNPVNGFFKTLAMRCQTLARGKIVDSADLHARTAIAARFAASNQQFFDRFLPGEAGFEGPGTEAATRPESEPESFDLEAVGDIVEEIGEVFGAALLPRLIQPDEALVLRDVALKYESGAPLSLKEALALMHMAKRLRPHGPVIKQKIRDWEA